MAWKWVREIKNAVTGTFIFAVLPESMLPGAATSMQVYGSQRQSNYDGQGNANFYAARGAIEEMASDTDRPIDNPTNNYNAFIYGKSGGTGVNIYRTYTYSGGSWNTRTGARKYLSFTNSVLCYEEAGSWSPTPLKGTKYGFDTWALEMNEDTEEMYLVQIGVFLRYPDGEGSVSYYDTAYIYCTVYKNNGQGNLWNILHDSIPGGSAGPYDDGGTSTGTETGTGDFDDTSEPIAIPTLPSVSALSSGLISLYKVSQTQVSKFVGFLWSDSFSVASLSKIFSDPMQAIISFGMFPFDVSAGASVPIYLGKNNTGAVGDLVTGQYVTVPMGSVNLTEFYGGALDYNPYTKIQLVLPYCGVVNINSDEFMTKAVTVTYRVDILSGACVAFVSDGERVLQQVNGNCLVTLPYASTDFKQVYSSLLGLAGTAGAAIVAGATGGLTAPVVGGIGASLAMNTLNAKENYARGGAAGSTLGFLGVQTPYLVITRPRQCLPENNGHFQGYPLYTTERLGDLTGFTKVAQIHLDDIDATDSELKEIARLLTEGVIL